MRVLQIGKFYPPVPGGVETWLKDLSYGLKDSGHQVINLVHKKDSSEPDIVQAEEGTILRAKTLLQLFYAPISFHFYLLLTRLLSRDRVDVVIAHVPNISAFCLLLLPVKVPIVLYWHSDVVFPRSKPFHRIAYFFYSVFEKRLLAKASKIICSSDPYLDASYPLRDLKDKCEVVPFFVEERRIKRYSHDEASSRLKKFGLSKSDKFIFTAGRFSHYKGFNILVEAAHNFFQDHPEVKIVLAGDGECRPEILKQIENSPFRERFICPGSVSDNDYWALMSQCTFFCLPSTHRSEAFGIVLIEALALGKKCVTTDIPGSGPSWVIRDGLTGIIASAGDHKSLSCAISTLLNSTSQKMNYPETRFEKKTVLRRLNSILQSAT